MNDGGDPVFINLKVSYMSADRVIFAPIQYMIRKVILPTCINHLYRPIFQSAGQIVWIATLFLWNSCYKPV